MNRVPLLVWFLIPTFILVGAGVWFFSKNSGMSESDSGDVLPAAVSQPVEGTADFQIVGRNHIASGTAGSGYNSNPPSSGPHWPSPAKNGIYDQALPDEQLIHNLEHGHVWIAYIRETEESSEATEGSSGPKGISDEDINKLKEIVKGDEWKIVMSPREKNDVSIALVAWGRVLKLDSFDEGKVKDFIRTYRNRGPENTPE